MILLNSSSAVLRVPAGSNVLYAELLWSGEYLNSNGRDYILY